MSGKGHNCNLCKNTVILPKAGKVCFGNKYRGKLIEVNDKICDEYEFGGFAELMERIGRHISHCPLFDGQPYIGEKDGKYHVFQGSLEADDIQKWYDTIDEAVFEWNSRVTAGYNSVRS